MFETTYVFNSVLNATSVCGAHWHVIDSSSKEAVALRMAGDLTTHSAKPHGSRTPLNQTHPRDHSVQICALCLGKKKRTATR
eukprot:6455978-Amphidinium_carterae.1